MQNRHTFVAQTQVIASVLGVFLAAFALFFIQPLWGRHLVMAFGGTAAVWNVLLFVFQSLLFMGYLLVFAAQFIKHEKLIIACLAVIAGWQVLQPFPALDEINNPTFFDLFSVFAPIALPVILLSVATPFLQRSLGLKDGANRYHLYSISNVGSFLALLAAPLLLMPHFSVDALFMGWRICVLGFLALLMFGQLGGAQNTEPPKNLRVWHKGAFWWFLWPFLSTGALHAYSQYLSNELANLPLIWIIPLVGYLISYIIAFTGKISKKTYVWFAAIMLVAAFAAALFHEKNWLVFALHLTAFFASCMFAHLKLYEARPGLSHMPLFYVFIAFAGMLAGLVNTQVFPYLLADTFEYPAYYAALFFVLICRLKNRALQVLGVAVLGGFVWAWGVSMQTPNVLGQWRNFYGVMKVVKEGGLHVYYNNGTPHEFQDFDGKLHAPPAYLKNLISSPHHKAGRVGVIGMGPGIMACYTSADQNIDFYEINPLTKTLVNTPGLFTFKKDCPREGHVLIGDGRLSFSPNEEHKYSVIVNTAHTGFSLPLHLITKEAFSFYKRHLTKDGVLLVIAPDRYISFHNALITTAKKAGFKALYVPNNRFKLQGSYSYPYSWYAFYTTERAKLIIRNADSFAWEDAKTLTGKCPVLTDAQHSFLQLAAFAGESCK